jgi:trehalose synthase
LDSENRLFEVHVGARRLEDYRPVAGDVIVDRLHARTSRLRKALNGRSIWNVNSTAVGGGVAEMLRPMLAYVRGAGLDARWLVIAGDPDFFAVTKRIHHALHGSAGDGLPLDETARRHYDATTRRNAAELETFVRPGDVVVLHDPQTLGLAPIAREIGARVLWRCHIGCDEPNGEVSAAWDFLRPDLEAIEVGIFSLGAYAPPLLGPERVRIIAPSIDPFTAKNQELSPESVIAILAHTGFVSGSPDGARPRFLREDGSPGRVERYADLMQLGPPPGPDVPIVVQISRWDPLKDHVGVMRAFERMLARHPSIEADLVLAGPNVHGVADDPEAPATYRDTLQAWRTLPHAIRRRVRLACLPVADIEENAAIVNALQRHATIVVQKSLHEGFGLTVAEAMWKGRPVLASAVGGIVSQIENGVSGLLLPDPRDLDACADALRGLLEDPGRATEIGAAARERVRERCLATRHLDEYAELVLTMVGEGSLPASR